MEYIQAIFVIATFIVFCGVGIWLFFTRGPKKSFEEEVREMAEDGYKTYRR